MPALLSSLLPETALRPRLEARGLAVRRGYRPLFQSLDLDLEPGEIVGLTAPNGRGKSTLLRLLAGFSAPDNGAIRWLPETGEPPPIQYLGHRDGLREALSPRENLAFAAGLDGAGDARVDAALEALGLERLADLPVQVLSAGQRRRVALARLVAAPRPVWLLDEPLAALDLAGRALVADLLVAQARSGGLALVATHQPLGVETRTFELGGAAP